MVHWNPVYYLKHAWDATSSGWGKLCIVLFYTFLWFNIIGALIGIFWPTMGTDCYFEGLSDYAAYSIASLMRQINVFALGFLLYADRGGIRIWNVAMVFVFWLFFSIVTFQYAGTYPELDGIPKGCPIEDFKKMIWTQLIWIFLALAASFMETKASNTPATGGESTPLTS